MPPIRRRAAPKTVAAIEEDYRLAREAGGLTRCPDHALTATVEMLDGDDPETGVRIARRLLATRLRQTCESTLAGDRFQAADRAAAWSLHASMLRDESIDMKLASIRRRAAAKANCSLGTDGIRKREDAVLRRAARAAHDDLITRQRERGPQSVEEAVRRAAPDIAMLCEQLHDGLPLVYQLAPSQDERMKNGFITNALLGASVALLHFHDVIRLHAEPGVPTSRVDFLFADIARHAWLVLFPDSDDKEVVRTILADLEPWSLEMLITAIRARPDGDAFLDRWRSWMLSCHPTCAYHRSDVVRLNCRPHQLVVALEEFGANHSDLVDGDLEAFLAAELTR